MTRLAFLFVAVVCAATCLAGENEREFSRRKDLAGAFVVAYDAFVLNIRKYSGDKGNVAEFMSDIGNYKVDIESNDSTYTINFAPKTFAGIRMRGGGGTYWIDRETLLIIRFVPRK